MIDVSIKINGEFLQGLSKTDIKLSVNSSSPFQFGESTRTYSGTIKAPRNKVNDMIFSQLRNFGIIKRDKRFYADLYIGGVRIPKEFRAKVTCNKDGYDIALTQRGLKMSDLPSIIVQSHRFFGRNLTDGGWYAMDLSYLLQDAFNNQYPIAFPKIKLGNNSLEPTIKGSVLNNVQGMADLNGSKVSVFWRYCVDSDEGSEPMNGNYIDIETWDIRSYISQPSVSSDRFLSMLPDADLGVQVVTLDLTENGSIPPTIYLRDRILQRVITTLSINGTASQYSIDAVQYSIGSTGWNNIPINYPSRGFEGFYLSLPTSASELKVRPSQAVSASEAFRVELKVTNIQGPTTMRLLSPGVSNGVDLLNNLCKMFLWRWKFSLVNTDRGNQPRIAVSKIIHDLAFDTGAGPIVHGDNPYRQDWSEFYIETEKIEDSEGIAQYNKIKIGDRQTTIPVSVATFSIREELFESSVPYSKDRSLPRFLMWDTTANKAVDYILGKPYLEYLNEYYRRFSDAVDVTIKAKIPYFYIENVYREDGIVWFKQLNAFFYVRSITDYSLSTQECKVKLTKINLSRRK